MSGWLIILAARNDQTLFVCGLALVAIVVWAVMRRQHPLEITIENGHVTALKGVAKAQAQRVVHFLERDVAVNGKVTVLGGRDANGVLRISFRGKIDEGTSQQVRNYLKMIL
jgi:hypothetical protein